MSKARTISQITAPTGSSLVGYQPAGTGALPATVSSQLQFIQNNLVFASDAPFYAKGDFNTSTLIGTDDTTAIQAALDSVGMRHNCPTETFLGMLVNQAQGAVKLAHRKNYKITSALIIPPGVTFDLNGSTIWQRTAGADCIYLQYLGGTDTIPYYARFFDSVVNGSLQGLGAGISTGRGLFLEIVNFGTFRDLKIQGFKYGRVSWEVQYTKFESVFCSNNYVNSYTTARPTDTSLTSIDNTYINCVDSFATKYGTWDQCQSSSTYIHHDSSRNGVADLVCGAALTGQLRTFTVTAGGSGYPINSTLPVTITDAGGGLYAQAYAETNGSGVVTGVFSVDAGLNYITPVVSVPGGGVAAVVSSVPVSDTDIGDWVGNRAGGITSGGNTYMLKVEHSTTDRPASGYAVVINSIQQRENRFPNPQIMRQGSGNRQYYRFMWNAGYGTTVTNPGDPSGPPDYCTNPAVANDYSVFRSIQYQGLAVTWGAWSNSNHVFRYIVGAAGLCLYDATGMTLAFDGAYGNILANGLTAEHYYPGYWVSQGRVYGDNYSRIQYGIDGTVNQGPGYIANVKKFDFSVIGSNFNADSNQTFTAGTSKQTQYFGNALAAARTVSLDTAGVYDGAKFRIVRSGLGAFTLTVQILAGATLKVMPSSTAAWAEFEYSAAATAWLLTGYGTL